MSMTTNFDLGDVLARLEACDSIEDLEKIEVAARGLVAKRRGDTPIRGAATADKFRRLAKDLYAAGSNDDIAVDQDALLSIVDNGVWVQGWLWVSNEKAGTNDDA
jgi:hypothetical protein